MEEHTRRIPVGPIALFLAVVIASVGFFIMANPNPAPGNPTEQPSATTTESPQESSTPAASTQATTPTEAVPGSTTAPTDPSITNPPAATEPSAPVTPPETQPTEPPATAPPETRPPVTEPPATQPPVTENDHVCTYEPTGDHQDATCNKTGYTKYRCAKCGGSFISVLEVIPHEFELVEFVPVLDGNDGYMVTKCKHCEATNTVPIPAELPQTPVP